MSYRLSLLIIIGFSFIGNCLARSTPEMAIPFELKEGRPFVQAKINGVSLSLLLDLGGYETVALTPSDSEMVAAKKTESMQRFSSSDGKKQIALGLQFDVKIGSVDFGVIGGSKMEGGGTSYVGSGLLGKKLLVLDYVQNQVRIYESGDKNALHRECGKSIFPVDIVRGFLQSYILTQGKVLTTAWDTGANFSVIRPSVLNLTIPEYIPDSQPDIHVIRHMRLNQLEFGTVKAALIEFKGPPVDLVLGGNFFQDKVVCLDGPAHSGSVR